MPLVKAAKGRRLWLASMATYTAGGGLASIIVGVTVGTVGSILWPADGVGLLSLLLLLGVCIAVMTRELGLIRLPLLQWRRQTSDIWARILPMPVAAGLWGFDLGLVFTTWLTFAGPWLLALLAFLGKDAGFAVLLFLAYWTGRVLTVWLAPLVLSDDESIAGLMEELASRRPVLRRVHSAGAAFAVVVIVAMVLTGNPMFGIAP